MYLEKLRLDGRRAFLTGAARGIGFAAAEALAEAGAEIVVSDLNGPGADEAAAKLRARGFRASAAALDVTDSAQCTEAADRANRDLGPVDILVANAGISWKDTPAEEMPDEAWRKVVDIDLNGMFWTCRAFGRHMLGRKRGALVLTGSMSGFISNKPQCQVHYNAAKAGVHHLARSLAGEWAERGVRVNCVAPTYVKTEITKQKMGVEYYYSKWMDGTPMRRMIEADEVASVIHFLASDAASGMTGSVVNVDAGYTVW